MILLSCLLFANASLASLGFVRLNLHFKLRRAESRGDFDEALRYLKKLKSLPATPLGRSLCDIMLLRAGNHLRDWEVVEETWAGIQARPKSLVRYSELAAGSYALSLAQRGRYRSAQDVIADLPLSTPTRGLAERCRLQALTILVSIQIKQGLFEEARHLLDSNRERLPKDPLIQTPVTLLEANIDFQQGDRTRCSELLLQLTHDRKSVQPFSDSAVIYALVRGLCRCGHRGSAEALFPRDPSPYSTPRLREMRLLAAAALCEQPDKALSYYSDLKALRTIDAEAYVRAANIAKRAGDPTKSVEFLQAALELDPESHWARVAHQKLKKTENG
jgi:tetratricopeptide (TPR) repeat protein